MKDSHGTVTGSHYTSAASEGRGKQEGERGRGKKEKLNDVEVSFSANPSQHLEFILCSQKQSQCFSLSTHSNGGTLGVE